jgi:trehalose 6-phosphate phosphatase
MIATGRANPPLALLENLDAIQERISSANRVSLFLDFDGTISGIVVNPGEAKLDPEIRSILKVLSARWDFDVCIVSGRALADVRERAGLSNVIYAGNHGLEIESDTVRFREPQAEALRRDLRCVLLQLKLALSDTDGLEIEDKGLTLSVHFRRVPEHLRDWVRNVTHSTVSRSRSFSCREGKLVLEVRPQITWTKGHAVKWIKQEVLPAGSVPIYIGDDVTDEDGFAAIPEGITVRVGETAETNAEYLLADVPAVGKFLRWLNSAKPHAKAQIPRTRPQPQVQVYCEAIGPQEKQYHRSQRIMLLLSSNLRRRHRIGPIKASIVWARSLDGCGRVYKR